MAVSWALPKGLPPHPKENRLAVHTEDHPLEYLTFEGEIPKGEYGGGTMTVWDRGTYEALEVARQEGHGRPARGARPGHLRPLPHQGQELDHPPHGPGRARAGPDAVADRADGGHAGQAPPRGRELGLRAEVGRGTRDRLLRLGPPAAREPKRPRHHLAVPGAARAGPRARLAAGRPRRRDRGVRRGREARLPAPPAAHAPRLRGRCPPARRRHAGDLRPLRPPLPGGARAPRAAVHRPAQAAGEPRTSTGPRGRPPPSTRARAGRCST